MRRTHNALLIALLTAATAGPAVARCADLALVLAIDASSSVDAAEFALQMGGSAAAFRDPRVLRSLARTGVWDVAAVIWGDARRAPQIIGWRRLRSAADADALASILETTPRRVTGETGLGAGVAAALGLLAGRCAARAVIDVSGDGRETWTPRGRPGPSITEARTYADAMGVTVNGLAIQNVEPALAAYYRLALATGPGAFVTEIARFEDLPAAITRKLLREIPTIAARDARLPGAVPSGRRFAIETGQITTPQAGIHHPRMVAN